MATTDKGSRDRETDGHDNDLEYDRQELKIRRYTHVDKSKSNGHRKNEIPDRSRVMKLFVGGKMRQTQLVSTEFVKDLTEHR